MKTSIITHPLWGNYGGMLQAYAMQAILKREVDIETTVVTQQPQLRGYSKLKYFLCICQLWLRLTTLNTPINGRLRLAMAEMFRSKHVSTTLLHNADRYVVGSDQVWRKSSADFVGGIKRFFLDFATAEQRNRSIAYAASFATDVWEGSPDETEACRNLLQQFKAVSVREHTGINICREVFGVEAVQMPDPTFLVHSDDYRKIIDSEKTWLPDGKYVAAYVLDETDGKDALLQESAETLNMQLQHLMPHATAKKRRDRFPISVPQWLRLIRDCEYFITDSFHGCVFAIIFSKPFVCLGNEGRGNARFDSLMETFGLQNRLITELSKDAIIRVLQTPIDWEYVNSVHDAERERGIAFLKANLSE